MTFVTRFAPSPTGRLHLGHAYSALLAHDWSRREGGRLLLRIEDIDTTRCRPEYEAAILEDLAWLGIAWPTPVRRQSEHFTDYASALEKLGNLGVLYRCFLTRREIAEQAMSAPHGPGEGAAGIIYRGPATPMSGDEQEFRVARGDPFAWRLSMNYSQDLLGEVFARLEFRERDEATKAERSIAARPEIHGDIVLARKDTPASYHLCVVHDDASQGVTHVIRGEDLRDATHVHVLLQRLLGLPQPIYTHHRLLTDEAGRRFAKRDRSLTLAALRDSGLAAVDIRARIGLPA
ncbi:MAG: tRNA glutamyl-Q(34) synthetase GluQRS [Hyphomonadaceae bacterium]|jgi:glutamyl-Q tRNA(Asp) synthetase